LLLSISNGPKQNEVFLIAAGYLQQLMEGSGFSVSSSNPAVSASPPAFRPHLAKGLAFAAVLSLSPPCSDSAGPHQPRCNPLSLSIIRHLYRVRSGHFHMPNRSGFEGSASRGFPDDGFGQDLGRIKDGRV